MSWNEDDQYYYEQEAAKDEFIEEISLQAISDFTNERLRSFYEQNTNLMRPAIDAFQEGKKLYNSTYYSASLVFFMTCIELLLKATILKPIVSGLVHHEALAEIIVEHTLGQAGFDRYEKLLEILISTFADLELKKISRDNESAKLFNECKALQQIRNKIIHRGDVCTKENAENARKVSVAVYELIVKPILGALDLKVGENGVIGTAYCLRNLTVSDPFHSS
jgi:hypothetical protein